MSGLPAEYYWHELQKLFGDYAPKPGMPCWHCHEPEAAEICFRFAEFGAAAHARLPRGTMPALDAITDLAEPVPEPASAPDPVPDVPAPTWESVLESDGLFMLRDHVISEDTIMAAAIKAAGGIHVLARKLGLPQKAIEQWTRIPAERLRPVASITGLPQHVLRPDLFDVAEPQSYWTEEEASEIWKWSHAWQLWLPLPYPPGFLPAYCCARRPRLMLVVNKE
jgi:hypothetical protein